MVQPNRGNMPTSPGAFEDLMTALDIEDSYTHVAGHRVEITAPVRRRLAVALGYPAGTDAEIAKSRHRLEAARWSHPLPPVLVLREDDPAPACPINLPAGSGGGTVVVRLVAETGESFGREWQGGDGDRQALPLPPLPGPGYHRLEIEGAGLEGSVPLIVTPVQGYLPEDWRAEQGGRRGWGFAIQLYGLRSRHNWGYGDFTDLGAMAEVSRRLGASTLGISPLHALFPGQPERCSPYSPLSRLFLNPLFIDPEAVPEFAAFPEAVPADFRTRLAKARAASPLLDLDTVADLKDEVLRALWVHFRERSGPRAEAFARFVTEGGKRLEDFGRFLALNKALGTWERGNWRDWPETFRDPTSPQVDRFAAANREEVGYHLFLQWLAEEQLAAAAGKAGKLWLGLYRDVAVGFDRDGFDAWAFAEAVPEGISVGCPPDLRNPRGQDWGVCPFAPQALKEAAYRPWIELLRANMRHAGMLRIDHAFQLARLYWIPLGHPPTEGGYLRYPMADLMGILALESLRNRCVVVAEDLGTFPDGFRDRMAEAGGLSFRVLHRERTGDRGYKAPETYPRRAVTVVATHDQATASGFWTGRDIDVRTQLDLYPSPEAAEEARDQRPGERDKLVAALSLHAGLAGPAEDAEGRPTPELVLAEYRFLARTPAHLVLVQTEDVLGQLDQMNMPGTVYEHPNWRRRGPRDLEEMADDPRVRALARMFEEEGRAADD
jgi:4-alpha-glucanotransferase